MVSPSVAERPHQLDADRQLARVEPGEPLVEEEKLRLEGKRPGKFQPLLVDIGELPGGNASPRRQPDAFEQARSPARVLLRPRADRDGRRGRR